MSYISDKVSYLAGLADGMEIENEKNGKLLRGIIDVLGAISEELDDQNENAADLADCIDELYDIIEEQEVGYDGEEEAEDFLEVVCPNCGETIYFDEEMLDDEEGLICPYCNETVDIDICPAGGCEVCDAECAAREE